jgi:hypothetical protein
MRPAYVATADNEHSAADRDFFSQAEEVLGQKRTPAHGRGSEEKNLSIRS